jgi:RHS repeat-associated protein
VVVNDTLGGATSRSALLTVTAAPQPPQVTGQPASQTVRVGDPATFTVTATGTATLTYQWYRNNVALTGATTASYTIDATTLADNGSTYFVRVTNALGYGDSNPATLTVNPRPLGTLDWKRDIVYLGTKEVAEIDATGVTVTLTDHLGSPRFVVEPNGNVIEQKFLPFGESLLAQADQARVAKGFTNHEQTDPSGLVYMQARFYGPMYHRFLSPDPARDQHFELTQSWNIYSYVRNNPTLNVDVTGKFSTPTHELINRQIFSGKDLKIINKSSLRTDGGRLGLLHGAQSKKNSFQHGMSSPKQTADEARKQAMEYKEKTMASAVQKEADGDHKGAMKELGKVMHLVQDMASPQHEGFQVWNGLTHPGDAMDHHKAEQQSEKAGLDSESVQKGLENSKAAKAEFDARVKQEQESREAEKTKKKDEDKK